MPNPPIRLDAPPETLDDDPPLSMLMTHRLIGITPDADIQVALRLMAGSTVRHLPVLNGGRYLGLVFEQDLVHAVVAAHDAHRTNTPRMASLYRPVPVLRADDRRSVAAARMRDSNVDAVVIMANDRLIGIVTATDMVRSLVSTGAGRPTRDRAAP